MPADKKPSLIVKFEFDSIACVHTCRLMMQLEQEGMYMIRPSLDSNSMVIYMLSTF